MPDLGPRAAARRACHHAACGAAVVPPPVASRRTGAEPTHLPPASPLVKTARGPARTGHHGGRQTQHERPIASLAPVPRARAVPAPAPARRQANRFGVPAAGTGRIGKTNPRGRGRQGQADADVSVGNFEKRGKGRALGRVPVVLGTRARSLLLLLCYTDSTWVAGLAASQRGAVVDRRVGVVVIVAVIAAREAVVASSSPACPRQRGFGCGGWEASPHPEDRNEHVQAGGNVARGCCRRRPR